MPTAYGTEGYVILSGVSFTGTEGAPGSTLNWTGLTGQSDINLSITDQDDNGSVNVGMPSNSFTPDYFGNFALGLIYSGYTISSGGTEYGVFTDGTNYYVPSTKTARRRPQSPPPAVRTPSRTAPAPSCALHPAA
ncbi:hypothetical protein KU6B_20110 [Mameliella alba]|uniref:hypothetical protein n=1 Tax=Mameliella alba TaxID=561184 RepID=UPI0013E43F25|nr:hypothetical protein [Mameliella alba]BBU55746.1 hypothetical protein KU6B_20110 [Mameliella alba]